MLAAVLLGAGVGAAGPVAGRTPSERVEPGPLPLAPRLSLTASAGFFDDAWTPDEAGQRLLVLRTDGDTFLRAELYDLSGSGALPSPEPAPGRDAGAAAKIAGTPAGAPARAAPPPLAGFDLPVPSRVFESVAFVEARPSRAARRSTGDDASSSAAGLAGGPGPAFLFVARENPDAVVAETYDLAGRRLGQAGPFWAVGTAGHGDGARLVGVQRKDARGAAFSYVVTSYALPALKPAGSARTFVVGNDGLLRSPAVKPIGFMDGYSKLLAEKPGAYDRKRDARQPSSKVTVDLLSGKLVDPGPIGDVTGWARTAGLRGQSPNRTAFVQVTGSGRPDGIQLIEPDGGVTPLSLPVPFRKYDHRTLTTQEGPVGGHLAFSLEIDPVNPDAVARQKATLPFLDVYGVVFTPTPTPPGAVKPLARVRLDERPVRWRLAGDRLVVQRRFTNFPRGGKVLEVFSVGP